jgi:Protein of unknown function (DUF3237)
MTPPASPPLEFVAHAVVDLGEPMELGEVPMGRRRVIPIVGGSITGPLGNAEILSGGADWQLVADDGTATIDTRYTARLFDGTLIYLATQGVRHGPSDVLERLASGADVAPHEYYFRLTVKLESGAAQLSWINRTVFVANAERRAASVIYDLFAVR